MNKLSLTLYALLALIISILITGQAEPVYSFFQSPAVQSEQSEQSGQSDQSDQSPVATPTNTPEPPPPTETPAPPTESESTNGAAEPTPTDVPALEVTPEPQDATPPLTHTQELTPIMPSLPQPAIEPPDPVAPREPAPSGEMIINEVKLIDTVVQWFAWIWMCLGVGVILFVLLLFPVLQMRGAHLKRNSEQ